MLKVILDLWTSHAEGIVLVLVGLITRALEKAALKKKYTSGKVGGTD